MVVITLQTESNIEISPVFCETDWKILRFKGKYGVEKTVVYVGVYPYIARFSFWLGAQYIQLILICQQIGYDLVSGQR